MAAFPERLDCGAVNVLPNGASGPIDRIAKGLTQRLHRH